MLATYHTSSSASYLADSGAWNPSTRVGPAAAAGAAESVAITAVVSAAARGRAGARRPATESERRHGERPGGSGHASAPRVCPCVGESGSWAEDSRLPPVCPTAGVVTQVMVATPPRSTQIGLVRPPSIATRTQGRRAMPGRVCRLRCRRPRLCLGAAAECCGADKVAPPVPRARAIWVDTLPPVPTSYLDVPVRYDLAPAMHWLETEVPVRLRQPRGAARGAQQDAGALRLCRRPGARFG